MARPVFDYHVGGPPAVVNGAIEAAIEDAIEVGGPGAPGWEAMQRESVRQMRRDPDLVERMRAVYRESGVTLPSTTVWSGDLTLPYREGVDRDLARWTARFDELEWMHRATGPGRARGIVEADDVGVVLNVQNLGAYTDGDPDRVDDLFNAGVRVMQLTYNTQNAVGTGCTDRSDGGLSDHGLAVVERLNDLGAVVDVSHCGERTTLDAVGASRAPVAVTHASCAPVRDHDRAKSDEELEALAANDGYFGVLALPEFIVPDGEEPSLSHLVDHVAHAASILGVERVGIGTDWGMRADAPDAVRPGIGEFFARMGFRDEHGLGSGPEAIGDFREYADWPAIPEALGERFSPGEVEAILGENFLAFWERVVDARA